MMSAKNLLVFSVIILSCFQLSAQKKLPTIYLFDDNRNTLDVTIESDGTYKLVFSSGDVSDTEAMNDLNEDVFNSIFKRKIIDLKIPVTLKSDSVMQERRKIYYAIYYASEVAQYDTNYAGEFRINTLFDVYKVTTAIAKEERVKDKKKKNYPKYKKLPLGKFSKLSSDSISRLNTKRANSLQEVKRNYNEELGKLNKHVNDEDTKKKSINQYEQKLEKLEGEKQQLLKEKNGLVTQQKNQNGEILIGINSNKDLIFKNEVNTSNLTFDSLRTVLNKEYPEFGFLDAMNPFIGLISQVLNSLKTDSMLIENELNELKETENQRSKSTILLKQGAIVNIDSLKAIATQLKDDIKENSEQLQNTKKRIDRVNEISGLLTDKNLMTLNKKISGYGSKTELNEKNIEDIREKILGLHTALNKDRKQRDDQEFELYKAYNKLRIAEDSVIIKNFEFEFAEFTFKDGFIEDVIVLGRIFKTQLDTASFELVRNKEGNILKFHQTSPIGFTRRMDYDRLKYRYLYAMDSDAQWYAISLGDLLSNEYIEYLKVGRRDFSPKNQVVKFTKEGKKSVVLEKENRKEVVQGIVFSDLAGINEDVPNGLIQTELFKKMPLLTERLPRVSPINLPRWPFRDSNIPRIYNIGLLQSIQGGLILSKIDNNNRRLVLSTADEVANDQLRNYSYATTLDLRQYEYLRTDIGLNVGTLDIPNGMSTWYLNSNWSFGRVAVTDSLRSLVNNDIVKTGFVKDINVSTFSWSPELGVRLQGDENYFFDFSFQHSWYYLRDNRFDQKALFPNLGIGNGYNRVQLVAGLNAGEQNKGKLFFRYRLFWQAHYWRHTFFQAQVGYAFTLFKTDLEENIKK